MKVKLNLRTMLCFYNQLSQTSYTHGTSHTHTRTIENIYHSGLAQVG